jgi:hypothetical protein
MPRGDILSQQGTMANIVLFEIMLLSQIKRRMFETTLNSDQFSWDLLFYLIDVSKNTQVLILNNGQN